MPAVKTRGRWQVRKQNENELRSASAASISLPLLWLYLAAKDSAEDQHRRMDSIRVASSFFLTALFYRALDERQLSGLWPVRSETQLVVYYSAGLAKAKKNRMRIVETSGKLQLRRRQKETSQNI